MHWICCCSIRLAATFFWIIISFMQSMGCWTQFADKNGVWNNDRPCKLDPTADNPQNYPNCFKLNLGTIYKNCVNKESLLTFIYIRISPAIFLDFCQWWTLKLIYIDLWVLMSQLISLAASLTASIVRLWLWHFPLIFYWGNWYGRVILSQKIW